MQDAAGSARPDVGTLERCYRAGEFVPRQVLAGVLERIEAYPDPAVWIDRLSPEAVLGQAEAVERRRRAGESLPLYGIPFAVKDNIDVAGRPTTAACPAYARQADRSAPVVRRLQRAGAILVGKTNLDQFAAGLAGDRTPYGVCRNVFDPAYIAGGSSTGSAVAVAAGLVSFALGTDTAGSGRVPAGCNNIVGLKPTPGLLSTRGVVPACRSLDCVSIFALTVDDAFRVCAVAARGRRRASATWPRPAATAGAGCAGFTFAVPRDRDLEFFRHDDQEDLFRQSIGRLEAMGGRRVAVDFRPFREVAALLYEGPWLAERLEEIGAFLQRHPTQVHPATRAVIQPGEAYRAVDLFRAMHRLRVLRRRCRAAFAQEEVLVVPTLPALPTRAEVQADSVGWSRRLGHYTNFVNLLRLAALAVPSGFTPRGLPGGITLIGPGGGEGRLCDLGMAWQRGVVLPLGATGCLLPRHEPDPAGPPPVPRGCVRVAVAGAHLRGQPLHGALLRTGARFVRAGRTAPRYRFVALMDLDPPRPGLLRDEGRAGAVAVELYDLPVRGFGSLVASVAPPLAIGTVELEDGEAVKGFLCESWAAVRALDITDTGGWAAFRSRPDAATDGGRAIA
jgi:allophanate hydrolase